MIFSLADILSGSLRASARPRLSLSGAASMDSGPDRRLGDHLRLAGLASQRLARGPRGGDARHHREQQLQRFDPGLSSSLGHLSSSLAELVAGVSPVSFFVSDPRWLEDRATEGQQASFRSVARGNMDLFRVRGRI
jgi:hypothetical protein